MIGECEMTGKRNVELFQVKIEGTVMNVCKEYVKYGERINKPKSFKSSRPIFSSKNNATDNEFIVKDYAMRIKQGREAKKLKQSQMANKLNEKESLIHNIESGHLKPNFPLAKKIAQFLNIILIEKLQPQKTMNNAPLSSGKPLTMEAAFLAAMKKSK